MKKERGRKSSLTEVFSDLEDTGERGTMPKGVRVLKQKKGKSKRRLKTSDGNQTEEENRTSSV